MSKINIVFFNVPKNLPMIGELMRYYQGQDDYETADVDNPSEVNQLLSMSGNGIILFKVETKPDLQAAVTLLKSQKKLLKKGLLKAACLSFVKSKKVEKILAKYGCQEVLNPRNITSKTFSFKINFWSKNIRAQLIQEEKDAAFQQRANNSSAKEATGPNGRKEDFKHIEALTLPSDIWISKLKIDHKKILKRYLSRLLGPSPHMGKWMELEPQPGDRLPTWKFVLKDPDGQLIMEDGAWYFSGSRPEFDWKINRWSFSSERPHLYFYTKEGKVFSRIKYENGQVLIPENSSYAMTKEQYILQTCESSFAFDKDKESGETNDSLEGGSADEVGGHYEGESSTDHLDDKLEGKSSTDQLEGDKKEGKNNYQEDDLGGNLEGKSKTDEIDGGPLSGDINHGPVVEEKDKKKSGYQEAPIDGNLSGKSSTDEIDHGPLSGETEGSKNASEEDKKNNFQEEAIDKHYEGQGSQEEVDRDPLSGELTEGSKKERKDKNGAYQEEKIDKHYNGKGALEEVDREPLSGEIEGAKKKKPSTESSGYDETPIESHDKGKGYTDDLSSPQLEGKVNPGKVKEENGNNNSFNEETDGAPLSGSSNTEELDRDPLSGEIGTQAKNKKNRSGSNDSEGQPELGGKSKTDHINHGPLSGNPPIEEDLEELERDPILEEINEKPSSDVENGLEKDGPGLPRPGKVKDPDQVQEGSTKPRLGDEKDGLNSETKNSDNDEIEELERDHDEPLLPHGRKLKEQAPLGTKAHDASHATGIDERDAKEGEIEDALSGGVLFDPPLSKNVDLRSKVVEANRVSPKDGPALDHMIGGGLSLESGEVKVIVTHENEDGEGVNHICGFEEFFPDELVVSTADGNFKSSEKVRVFIRLIYAGEKMVIETTGVVEDVEGLENGEESVAISIDEIDERIYNKFMGLYQQRQENIHQFIKQAKGQD